MKRRQIKPLLHSRFRIRHFLVRLAARRVGYGMLPTVATTLGVHVMAKGLDKKKETKKKPAKTLKEKRAEKGEKKATRGFAPT